jgi:dolichyl-phosphate beta-glucosyltransferase
MSRAYCAASRAVSGVRVRDFNCGYKCFRRAAAREIFERVRELGWCFDVELLAIARALGYRVCECGVTWEHKSGSKVKPLRAAASSALGLARIAARRAARLYARGEAEPATEKGEPS